MPAPSRIPALTNEERVALLWAIDMMHSQADHPAEILDPLDSARVKLKARVERHTLRRSNSNN